MKTTTFIQNLLNVPSTDPDDARRRRLLNILLVGVGILAFLGVLATAVADIGNLYPVDRLRALYVETLTILISVAIIFWINRRISRSGWLASVLFLTTVTIVLTLGDEPQEVAQGRSVIMLAIPIVMASVLLSPWASFAVAGICSVLNTLVALSINSLPNPFIMVAFFTFAMISWLSARSLMLTLRDLRALNRELDERVRERTRDLAEALARNEAVLESIADGVVVFSDNGEATVANRAVADLLERPARQIVGQNIERLMRENIHTQDQDTIGSLLVGEPMEEPSVKFAWGSKTLSASVAPVQLSSGEKIGSVAVFRDFTHEAEVDRMKSTFVSIASHELRTPLNAILGYVEMLGEGVYGQLTEQQNGAIDRLMANTGHMLSLVNNLLDRARIEAGTLTLNISEFSPATMLDSVHGVMDVMASVKSIQLIGQIDEDVPPTLSGDWQRLHQILINLVNNAIKFTEEGTIDVHISRPDVEHWAIQVADTGIGIPETALSYIFEPFRQADDSATREYGGAGLGLSIVDQLVTLMGGTLDLESKVGQGSTFTIVLPLDPPRDNRNTHTPRPVGKDA